MAKSGVILKSEKKRGSTITREAVDSALLAVEKLLKSNSTAKDVMLAAPEVVVTPRHNAGRAGRIKK